MKSIAAVCSIIITLLFITQPGFSQIYTPKYTFEAFEYA